jgi:hypothetical protein
MKIAEPMLHPVAHQCGRILCDEHIEHTRRSPQSKQIRDTQLAQHVDVELIWQSE